MSDETKRMCEEASAAVDAARMRACVRKQECLDVIADGIPAAVERIAKRTAQEQPEVTKGLGVQGIRSLRSELATEAAELAEYVRAGSSEIQWPHRDSEWSKVGSHHIHSALFTYMYGSPVDKIGAVFDRRGYDTQKTPGRGAQGLVLPQSLYDRDSFEAVADSLNELAAAEAALKAAKEADDRDVVDSLWDDA
ncbi:hypothetical protein G6010_14330 [Dietzia sp. SLG510A3-3B2-2]|nr:hypothetical protein [Dietzia sp. SLG510A3-40A3]MBB1010624.1 hypothetical protein [Dietzia sp. SLG510A3-3B2-2]